MSRPESASTAAGFARSCSRRATAPSGRSKGPPPRQALTRLFLYLSPFKLILGFVLILVLPTPPWAWPDPTSWAWPSTVSSP